MTTIIWALAGWALLSIPLGLLLARGIARMNPVCEIADTTNWDDIRTALIYVLPSARAARTAGAAPAFRHDASVEAEAAAQLLPAARKVA